jgi:hypothetical protein
MTVATRLAIIKKLVLRAVAPDPVGSESSLMN